MDPHPNYVEVVLDLPNRMLQLDSLMLTPASVFTENILRLAIINVVCSIPRSKSCVKYARCSTFSGIMTSVFLVYASYAQLALNT